MKNRGTDGKLRAKRTYSLRWGFFVILIVCWVLPVLIFSGSILYLISENVSRHTGDTLTHDFNNSVVSAQSKMDSLFEASRSVSYDSVLKSSHETYLSDYDFIAHHNRVTSYLTTKYKYDDNITDAFLCYTDEPSKIFNVPNAQTSGGARRFQTYIADAHKAVMEASATLGTDIRFMPSGDGVLLVRNINDKTYKPYAVIALSLNTSRVFSSLENLVGGNNSAAGVVYIDGEKVWDAGSGMKLGQAPGEEGVPSEISLQKRGGNYLLRTDAMLEDHRVIYAATIPDTTFSEQFSAYYYIIIFSLIMTLILVIVWMLFFYRNINKPVRELVRASNEIEAGHLGYQIEALSSGKEFNYLSESYNSMSGQLKTMFEQSIAEQMALQDARINALQSQINPHFLNNTLEIINWEARMAKADNVSNMIEALSTMLSAAMNRDGNSMIRVADEFEYLDSYLYIVAEKLKNKLTIVKEIDESLTERLIPRLIMQPLAENAIEHGIVPNNGGVLVLRLYEDDGSLFLEVESDGTLTAENKEMIETLLGYTEGEPTTPAENGKIGIRNVNQRIKLIYGEKSALTVTALENKRILSKIKISPITHPPGPPR
jgi:two-component system sensor histidine kinase YesM